MIDNTFATPFGQNPLRFGIDVVVHSLTKSICGFGTEMGGAVIGPRALESDLLRHRKDFGGTLSSRAAWSILVYGLPTLALRLRHQQRTAQQVAARLEEHPLVREVGYPGLASFPQKELADEQMRSSDDERAPGAMIYFCLKGTAAEALEAGARLMDHLAANALTVTLAVSLGPDPDPRRTSGLHDPRGGSRRAPAGRGYRAGRDPPLDRPRRRGRHSARPRRSARCLPGGTRPRGGRVKGRFGAVVGSETSVRPVKAAGLHRGVLRGGNTGRRGAGKSELPVALDETHDVATHDVLPRHSALPSGRFLLNTPAAAFPPRRSPEDRQGFECGTAPPISRTVVFCPS